MKLTLSISASGPLKQTIKECSPGNAEYMQQARKYFSTKAIYDAFHQPINSTQTVVFMAPDQYLQLTDDGDMFLDVTIIEGFITKNIRYDSLPYLGVETDEDDGSLYVSLEGRDHHGRRMMKVLLGLGIEKVPVIINSQQYDDGPAYLWGMTDERPETIEGANDTEFKFPPTETY